MEIIVTGTYINGSIILDKKFKQELEGKKIKVILLHEEGKKNRKRKLKNFFSLANKIDIDENEIIELREKSKI